MAAAAEVLKKLPVGFRFHPTEVELVSYYLQNKILGLDSHANLIIADIDIVHYEPWDLPEFSLIESIDDEWFFFSRPEYTSTKRNQIKRSTDKGYWKSTCRENPIQARGGRVVGNKRILTFYTGRNRNNSKITNWVIHEYYIPQTNPTAKQRDIVLCRLIKKPDKRTGAATCDEGGPSNNASDVDNELQPAHDMVIQMPPQENGDYFERERERMLASSRSNAVYNESHSGFGDDEWVDSVLVYQESCDKLTHIAHFNDSTGSRPLRVVADGVCSDTDAEAPSTKVMIGSGPSRRDSIDVVRLPEKPKPKPPAPEKPRLVLAFDECSTNERGSRTGYPLSSTRDAVKLPEKPKEPERPKPRPAVDLPKESITKFTKDKKETQGKGSSFISWETIPLTSAPSVYLFNAGLGTFLFMVFARELVSC